MKTRSKSMRLWNLYVKESVKKDENKYKKWYDKDEFRFQYNLETGVSVE